MESRSPKHSLDLSLPWLGGADYVSRLQVELRKMEAFERELPLSILLLTDAIERLKKGVESDLTSTRSSDADKRNWMSSAKLWSSDQTLSSLQLHLVTSVVDKPRDAEERQGGTFSSFHCVPGLSPAEDAVCNTERGLCLLVSEPAGLKMDQPISGLAPMTVTEQLKLRYGSQPKQRRCWSPELHLCFVEALDRLGGPQVATPKQIRELMQVNGLTNDEVKSHLQKYRLHLRKRPNSLTSLSEDNRSLTQDSQLEGSGASSSGVVNGVSNSKLELKHSGSPEGPFHLATASAKSNSMANGCGSMENDYEEKSDSRSWEGGD